jgi:hypothetical protein
MSKAVGVLINGSVEWHAPAAGGGDYHTLCGLDAADETLGHMGFVEAKRGQKIDCHQCLGIWRDVIAMRLRRSDFS